jgi:hypothetical protein
MKNFKFFEPSQNSEVALQMDHFPMTNSENHSTKEMVVKMRTYIYSTKQKEKEKAKKKKKSEIKVE